MEKLYAVGLTVASFGVGFYALWFASKIYRKLNDDNRGSNLLIYNARGPPQNSSKELEEMINKIYHQSSAVNLNQKSLI